MSDAEDDEPPKKKVRKAPARQSSDQEKILKTFMKEAGVEGSLKQIIVPCNIESIWSDEADPHILNVIRNVVVYTSRVKPLMTLFINWMALILIERHLPLPTLSNPFFTSVEQAVTGQPSPYTELFREFCKKTGHSCLDSMANVSQVMIFVKKELVTCGHNALLIPFFFRRLAFIRWKVADALSAHLSTLGLKKRKSLLYAISQVIVRGAGEHHADFARVSELPAHYLPALSAIAVEENMLLAALKVNLHTRLRDDWVNRRFNSEKNTYTREELGSRFDLLSLEALISEDPMPIVAYNQQQMQLVHQLHLTRTLEHCQVHADWETAWPWKWKQLKIPSFPPLFYSRVGRHFIRMDKKALVRLGVEMKEDRWWMSNIFSLYGSKKRGRISHLYESRELSDPRTVTATLSALGRDHRPFLPGASFVTDGVSVHISLLTTPSPHDNIDSLMKRGYTGVPLQQTNKAKVDIGMAKTGVHKLESCVIRTTLTDTDLIGCDPGKIQVVACSRVAGSVVIEDREALVTTGLAGNNTCAYSEMEYKKNTGRTESERHEALRRNNNPRYQQGLALLSATRRDTFDVATLETYATARAQADPLLQSELHDIRRSFKRRRRFVRVQRCLGHIVHKMLGRPDRKVRRLAKKGESTEEKQYVLNQMTRHKVVFFGRALFSGVKGHVSVPRKKLIRALACHSLVVLTDEFNTSKLCPYDFAELQDIGERLRLCKTVNHHEAFSCDRDLIGSINILQKGIYHLLERPLTALYQSNADV